VAFLKLFGIFLQVL